LNIQVDGFLVWLHLSSCTSM